MSSIQLRESDAVYYLYRVALFASQQLAYLSNARLGHHSDCFSAPHETSVSFIHASIHLLTIHSLTCIFGTLVMGKSYDRGWNTEDEQDSVILWTLSMEGKTDSYKTSFDERCISRGIISTSKEFKVAQQREHCRVQGSLPFRLQCYARKWLVLAETKFQNGLGRQQEGNVKVQAFRAAAREVANIHGEKAWLSWEKAAITKRHTLADLNNRN